MRSPSLLSEQNYQQRHWTRCALGVSDFFGPLAYGSTGWTILPVPDRPFFSIGVPYHSWRISVSPGKLGCSFSLVFLATDFFCYSFETGSTPSTMLRRPISQLTLRGSPPTGRTGDFHSSIRRRRTLRVRMYPATCRKCLRRLWSSLH